MDGNSSRVVGWSGTAEISGFILWACVFGLEAEVTTEHVMRGTEVFVDSPPPPRLRAQDVNTAEATGLP